MEEESVTQIERRRAAIGFAAGLFQGPAFLWGQLGPTVAGSTGEAEWVRWSPLGLVLSLLFGLVVLAGDRIGARPLILSVCGATLAGAALLAIGGAGIRHAHWFALVAVAGSFVQFAATRAGVLVSAHETQGLHADQQLAHSRGLRRWFVIGIYLPAFGAGVLAARLGWVWVYGALGVLYAVGLVALWRLLRTERDAAPARVPLGLAVRAGAADPRLVITAIAAFCAQAVVFGGVQGLPMLLRGDHLSGSMIGYAQGSAIVAALLVARPRKLAHTTFGRIAPLAAPLAVAISAAVVGLTHHGHSRTLLLLIAGGAGLGFITMELLKQWSQSVAQVQTRERAAPAQDYARQALWLLAANLGAITGAETIARLAARNSAQWLLALSIAGTLFVALSLLWYEIHGRVHRDRTLR
jgi:hypothetical protein